MYIILNIFIWKFSRNLTKKFSKTSRIYNRKNIFSKIFPIYLWKISEISPAKKKNQLMGIHSGFCRQKWGFFCQKLEKKIPPLCSKSMIFIYFFGWWTFAIL
jgi:hypothetical protein